MHTRRRDVLAQSPAGTQIGQGPTRGAALLRVTIPAAAQQTFPLPPSGPASPLVRCWGGNGRGDAARRRPAREDNRHSNARQGLADLDPGSNAFYIIP